MASERGRNDMRPDPNPGGAPGASSALPGRRRARFALAVALTVLAQAAATGPGEVRGATSSFVDAFDRPDSSALANDPDSPFLSLIGTATWTGPRPANLAATGKVGLAGTATQGYERVSLTNLRVDL